MHEVHVVIINHESGQPSVNLFSSATKAAKFIIDEIESRFDKEFIRELKGKFLNKNGELLAPVRYAHALYEKFDDGDGSGVYNWFRKNVK